MRRHCISAAAHRSCIFVVRVCSSIMVCFPIMIFFSSILFFHFAASVDQVCVIRCSNQYSRSHLQRGRICRLRIPCNQNLYHILSFHTFLSAWTNHLINFGCFAAVGRFVESLYGFVYDFFTPCLPYCVAVLFVIVLSLRSCCALIVLFVVLSLCSCLVYSLKTDVPPRGHWRFLDVWKFYLNTNIIWYFMMQSAAALPDKTDGKSMTRV